MIARNTFIASLIGSIILIGIGGYATLVPLNEFLSWLAALVVSCVSLTVLLFIKIEMVHRWKIKKLKIKYLKKIDAME